MHPRTRAAVAAAVLAAAAGALLYLGRPGPAVVLAGVAVALLVMVPDRSLELDVAQALHDGPVRTAADAAEAIRLEGKGILRPHEGSVMLFLPTHAAEPEACPVFDGQTRLHHRPPVGMWVDPPGAGLFEAWRGNASLHSGIEGATASLRQAIPGMGLGRAVHVEQGETVRVTYRPQVATRDDPARPWHLLGGDAVTSFIGMVLAHALDRPVQLVHRDEVDDGVRSEWRT